MSLISTIRSGIRTTWSSEQRVQADAALESLRSLLIEADSAISHLHYRKTWPLDSLETDRLIARLREAAKG